MSPPYQGQTFPSLAEAQKVAMSAGAGPQGFAGNLPVPGSGNGEFPVWIGFWSLSLGLGFYRWGGSLPRFRPYRWMDFELEVNPTSDLGC